jgi:hypothetical protein
MVLERALGLPPAFNSATAGEVEFDDARRDGNPTRVQGERHGGWNAARESLCKGLTTGSVGHFRSYGHFSRKRQKSERPGADGRNYSRSRSHLRAAAAMIGIKSPGLDGGCTGVRAKTGTCSWGRAVPPYYLGGARCLTRLSSIGAARWAAPILIGRDPTRSAPIF